MLQNGGVGTDGDVNCKEKFRMNLLEMPKAMAGLFLIGHSLVCKCMWKCGERWKGHTDNKSSACQHFRDQFIRIKSQQQEPTPSDCCLVLVKT